MTSKDAAKIYKVRVLRQMYMNHIKGKKPAGYPPRLFQNLREYYMSWQDSRDCLNIFHKAGLG